MIVTAFVRRAAHKPLLGHPLSIWLLWALGAALLLSAPMALADPGIWMLVLDPELLALMIAVAFAATRIGAGLYLSRLSAAISRVKPRGSSSGGSRRLLPHRHMFRAVAGKWLAVPAAPPAAQPHARDTRHQVKF